MPAWRTRRAAGAQVMSRSSRGKFHLCAIAKSNVHSLLMGLIICHLLPSRWIYGGDLQQKGAAVSYQYLLVGTY